MDTTASDYFALLNDPSSEPMLPECQMHDMDPTLYMPLLFPLWDESEQFPMPSSTSDSPASQFSFAFNPFDFDPTAITNSPVPMFMPSEPSSPVPMHNMTWHDVFSSPSSVDPSLLFSGPCSPAEIMAPSAHHPTTTPISTLSPPASPSTVSSSFTSTPTTSPRRQSQDSTSCTKKTRFRATKSELDFLLQTFETNPFPTASQRNQIAKKLQLEAKQILFWFQNRRATLKTNGIVAVKPKKANRGLSFSADQVKPEWMQLSKENPYFYVSDLKAVKL
ncbi:hypothetical protein HDU98_005041 [Podochytrium sp. JEL0797]|nr:hypothetical protein HDU98_005041 [Podochytrium sp. JEL0797]